ncbi:MAG: hypothetical protein KF733_03610 [Fimbriimonadaceae bacterium]|nr:MAG: hypothetical protein KF733_03610 [Fimbriimonadaceae bacterium]
MKVVILSASTGNGHMSAAFAVEKELEARGHRAITVDTLDHTGLAFKTWYRGGYEMLVRRIPWLWGWLYGVSDSPGFEFKIQNFLDTAFVERVRPLIDQERPDWVLCTHSLPQPALARWRPQMGFKMGIIVTDLYPQLMWLRGEPDHFFVPVEWTRERLLSRMPALSGKVTVSGMPIDRRFGERPLKSEVRQSLGLDPSRPTVLVTSGGIGGGPLREAARALAAVDGGLQGIVVCGRNEDARRGVLEALEGREASFKVHGHVSIDKMIDFMHAADFIVAKPGGLTTFEAMAAGLPFLVYRPFLIPGQEEGNGDFLQANGIGEWVEGSLSLTSTLRSLIEDRGRLEAMSAAALRHAQPDATRLIVDSLETLGAPMAMAR